LPEDAGVYDSLPAALGDGTKDGEVIRFLYAVTGEQMPEKTVVWIALYADSQLNELTPATLVMESDQIHELEIDLTEKADIDSIKIFQVRTDMYSPLWFAAKWSESSEF